MGHHWRAPRPQAPADTRPSPLAEFLDLFLNVFLPEGRKGEWLPFDTSPSSFKRKPKTQV